MSYTTTYHVLYGYRNRYTVVYIYLSFFSVLLPSRFIDSLFFFRWFLYTGYTSSFWVSSDIVSLNPAHHHSCSHLYSISKITHYTPVHSTYSYLLLLLRIFFLYINNPELGMCTPTKPQQFQLQRSCARGPGRTLNETVKTTFEIIGHLKG